MKNSPIYDRIERALKKRHDSQQFRTIPQFSSEYGTIDLSTNSYLSLHTNKTVQENAQLLTSNIHHGNLASRLVGEHSPLFGILENEVSSWKGTEAALIFNSGYAANIGIIQALCTKDTEIFCDRLNHASIYDGIFLSGTKINRYVHNDMIDLKKRLQASKTKEKIIITDTVFSMDGDCAPISDICELAKQYSCMVMVDEAHGSGIFGANGGGLTEAAGIFDAIDIRMGTFSKAIAGLGGFCAVSKKLRDYFVNFCRSLIYSTGLPHSVLAHNLAAIRFIRSNPGIGKQLLSMADDFRSGLFEAGFSTLHSTTQIIPCLMDNEGAALSISKYLRQKGIIAPAIRPPTVPEGSARLRISISLGLTNDQSRYIIEQIKLWKKSHE
jgi:8-amino-7-oxononanoate synthase